MDLSLQFEPKLQFTNCKVRCVWKMIFTLQESFEIMMSNRKFFFFRKMSNSKKVINQHENCFSFFLAQRPKKKKMSQKKRSKFCGLGMNYLFPGWIFEQSSVTGSGAKSSSVFKYFLFVKLATVLSQLVFVLFTTLSKKGWTFASKAMRSSISLCKRSQSHNSPWTFSVFFLTYKRRSNFRQT